MKSLVDKSISWWTELQLQVINRANTLNNVWSFDAFPFLKWFHTECFWIWNSWSDKTDYFKLSPWALRYSFFFPWYFINQVHNQFTKTWKYACDNMLMCCVSGTRRSWSFIESTAVFSFISSSVISSLHEPISHKQFSSSVSCDSFHWLAVDFCIRCIKMTVALQQDVANMYNPS